MSAVSGSLIFTATMPVALLLGTGYALRKRGVVDEQLRSGMMNLVIWVFFPALVLSKVSHNEALKDDAVAVFAPLAGFLSLAAGYAISRIFAGVGGADTPERRRAFVYTTGNYNYGYLAIPVSTALYGPDSVAVLLLFNVGIELCLWTLGLVLLSGKLDRDAWKRIFNPITIAMIVAMILNRAGLADHTPKFVFSFADMLGACAIPCGLLLIGMALPALLDGFRARHDLRITVSSVLLRNGLIPACFVLAALFLGLPPEVSRILLLQAAMPAALLPSVMCQHYGQAPQVSLRIAVATTLAGVATLPAWLWLGGRLAHAG